MEEFIPLFKQYATLYGLRIIGALLLFVVGRWIAKLIRNLIDRQMAKRNIDDTIAAFISSLSHVAMMTFIIIAAIKMLGIDTAGFVAVIAAAGLAIGFALQGSLSNFAAGFLLILFRPFRKGDFIEGGGTTGIVEEIQIFTTILKTPDNKTIIIPNGKMMGDNITNYSANDTRRIDFVFGVGYTDNLQTVRNTLQSIAKNEDRILKDPEPMVAVKELADSSVNLLLRVWVKTEDYWDVFFEITETVKNRFDEENISIPFPQRDVHLFENK